MRRGTTHGVYNISMGGAGARCYPKSSKEAIPMKNERGAVGWGILWLLGVPTSVLVVLFLARGCT